MSMRAKVGSSGTVASAEPSGVIANWPRSHGSNPPSLPLPPDLLLSLLLTARPATQSAPRLYSVRSAVRMASSFGGDGNGNEHIFSMPIAFMCRTVSQSERRVISGGKNRDIWSLKTAEEKRR